MGDGKLIIISITVSRVIVLLRLQPVGGLLDYWTEYVTASATLESRPTFTFPASERYPQNLALEDH